MRRALLLSLIPIALGCNNPETHACAGAFVSSSSAAAEFCATFTASTVTATTGLPDSFASACDYKTKHLSSACSCLDTAWATAGASSGSEQTTTVATSVVATSVVATSVVATSTAPVVVVSTDVPSSSPTTLVKTTRPATSTASSVVDVPTTTEVPTTTQVTSIVAAESTGTGTTCIVSEYASLSSAVASCTNIVLSDLYAPPSSTIDLQGLQTGATVTFAGTTTFGDTYDDDFDPIVISGTDITITGAEGHVIEGNGAAYWDGEGSNGGQDKPDHFIVVKKTYNSKITNLNIMNWPVHCFDITGCQHLTISGLTLNNTAGDEPNSASGDDPAAHNSDGFDISSSDYITLENIEVYNQDDCVAVTSGTEIVVDNLYCSGGHGLSIGSIGGKSNNTVNGVTFKNSQVVDSENGCRIKTNSDTTGTVENIVYENITLSGITDYGIDIQQDYLNGGPTGDPTNGVTISGVTFTNVQGTATDDALDYYILCGSDSCSDFTFTDVSITGGGETSSCNYPSSGCP
ncbi:endopolygalacturonase D [Penicillium macrosclerotiorum]|uniref:endopolygalacturonase D n=1 Tax=Penicillium macrosclerotiorum TaxID=303699 RepID=UPI00254711A6|nr:endopolygalacturonase D [Penicillium macrosclerotiorum]KAJ5679217.1 endopolygalacturonase D [Penicillium macrosclerotiorum]